jgi:hypothetical protein
MGPQRFCGETRLPLDIAQYLIGAQRRLDGRVRLAGTREAELRLGKSRERRSCARVIADILRSRERRAILVLGLSERVGRPRLFRKIVPNLSLRSRS